MLKRLNSLRSRMRASRVRSNGNKATDRASRPSVSAAKRADRRLSATGCHAAGCHATGCHADGCDDTGSYPLPGRLRLVVDLTGHYGSFATAELSQTALMSGVRGVWSWHRLSPFAEGLLGFARTGISASGLHDADTDWGPAFGVGVDYPLSRRWSARGLAQLRLLHGEGAWDTDPRFSLGAVYRFGR
jgi:hypothetical protein